MSDNKLIKCRAERDRLKTEVLLLHKLIGTPEKKALKQLYFKNRILTQTVAALHSKVSSLEQSGKALFLQIEPLREVLRAEKRRTTEFVQERAKIVAWFNQHGHKLALNEPIIQKLDNIEAGLQSHRQLAKDATKYFADYPELAKTDNCEKAVAFLRKGKDATKQTKDKELVAHAAVIGQYKLDLEATANALGLLKEAADLLALAEGDADDEVLAGEIEEFLNKPEIKAILKKEKTDAK